MAEQSFKNHAKLVPAFHYFVVPVLLANFIWATRLAIQMPRPGAFLGVATALALLTLAFLARLFALKVQDRVIRLEMRLKLRELLPASLHSRIAEFTPGQLVALRFASDAELAALAETVLRDGVTDKKAIKAMIKVWNPDHLRA